MGALLFVFVRPSCPSCLRGFLCSSPETPCAAAEGADLEGQTVCDELDLAVPVGAEDFGTDALVARQHGRGRMAEEIAAAGADEYGGRAELFHPAASARGQASVMRRFEDVEASVICGGQKFPF